MKLFIDRGADLRIKNDYGGDTLGAALWGAANDYPPVVELLIARGVNVEREYADWWERQEADSPAAHARILQLLRAHEMVR